MSRPTGPLGAMVNGPAATGSAAAPCTASTATTRDAGGAPVFRALTRASTDGAGPAALMRTPSESFLTQPRSPSLVASRWTKGRNPTPWTTPRTRSRTSERAAGGSVGVLSVTMGSFLPHERIQQVVPFLHSLPAPCGAPDQSCLRGHPPDVFRSGLQVEAENARDIDLGDEHDVGRLENRRVLERLFFSPPRGGG